jgi:hypothetical protein
MDSLSALDPLAWEADYLREHPAYHAGNALGWLYRGNKQAATSYPLAGRLYLAKSGWLLLSVPNALVRGVFDALTEPGTELPTAGVMNVPNVDGELLNAHISVLTADEVASIGADKINERGHMFGYTLGGLKEIDVKNVDGVSKVWVLHVASPGLSALRKSYGLSALPKDDQPFHITFAVRRKGVLRDNGKAKGYETPAETAEGHRFSNPISRGELKAASDMPARDNTPDRDESLSRSGKKDLLSGGNADNVPAREFSAKALAEGAKHEHEHTDNDQIAGEIAKDHLSEDPRYYEKQKALEKASYAPRGTDGSVYAQQFKNLLDFRTPLVYDHDKPVFQNVTNHLVKAHQRANFILQSRQKAHMYRMQLDPQYRHQISTQAFHGTLPQMNTSDKIMQLYGNDIFDTIQGWGKK